MLYSYRAAYGVMLPLRFAKHLLMRRSSKAIDESTTERAVWRRWAAPDPRLRVAAELGGRDASSIGDVLSGGEQHANEDGAAEDPRSHPSIRFSQAALTRIK